MLGPRRRWERQDHEDKAGRWWDQEDERTGKTLKEVRQDRKEGRKGRKVGKEEAGQVAGGTEKMGGQIGP